MTPTFLEMRAGQPKVVSFFAKKARGGSMARFMIQNRLRDPPEALKEFDLGGYRFQPDRSEGGDNLVFLRDEGA